MNEQTVAYNVNTPAPVHSTGASGMLEPLIKHLFQLLENENTHLKSGGIEMLETFAREKMQILMQLNHLARDDNFAHLGKEHKLQLQEARKLLDTNMQKLKFRMRAIGEITQTIENAAAEADSDGTYIVGNMRKGI